MPMKRVVELVGGHNLAIKRYVKGRTAQQFFFDQTSKTVKSQQYKDRSIDIQSNGKNRNLRMTTTNSRWW
jgi:hypothetical protein